ncbi:MAG TPA: hypothetical protein VK509_23100 [Polyangiales bacterium]|nr:hypothetical protein [Polyangiales bacterium]
MTDSDDSTREASTRDASPRDYPVSIRNRGPARAVGHNDGVLLLTSELSHPPGRPLELTVQLPDGMLTLSGKIIGSKRRPDNHYDVQLRLSSVRREQRAALVAAFA